MTGAEIRAARLKIGWTQGELGKRVGVAVSTVNLWENERHNPTNMNVMALRKALDDDEPESGLMINIGEAACAHVARLHASGLWGTTIEDTIRLLFLEGLRAHVCAGSAP